MKLEWKKVQSVEPLDEEAEVFNVEMEDNNNYFAEGILVHNCYADSFRASLYSAFFDNHKDLGYRHCNTGYFEEELGKILDNIGKKASNDPIQNAFNIGVPVRFGIRFEDFLTLEKKGRISYYVVAYGNHNPSGSLLPVNLLFD